MRPFRALAFDLGASNGRAVLGTLEGDQFHQEEIARFDNIPLFKDGRLFWDYSALLNSVKDALLRAGEIDSFGFDTWGVDFGILDRTLLENPVNYRDEARERAFPLALSKIGEEELFLRTGNQIMPINSLFALYALQREHPELLKRAKSYLFMPDLFSYSFTGVLSTNETIASTSQLFSPLLRKFDRVLFEKLSLCDLFPPVSPCGSEIGSYLGKKVISIGHDTQCAAALSTADAFLSCGTWSLLGAETDSPVLDRESFLGGFSNEIAANGKIDVLKNIIGLWILQECKREWDKTEKVSYSRLEEEAKGEFFSMIDPDSPEFAKPSHMPEKIRAFCEKTHQEIPKTRGEMTRCVYYSLAMKYREAIETLANLTKKPVSSLQILGGGAKAELLCRLTADVSNVAVQRGPTEATALGNLMIQLSALSLRPREEIKEIILNSEKIQTILPSRSERYESDYQKFLKIKKGETA